MAGNKTKSNRKSYNDIKKKQKELQEKIDSLNNKIKDLRNQEMEIIANEIMTIKDVENIDLFEMIELLKTDKGEYNKEMNESYENN